MVGTTNKQEIISCLKQEIDSLQSNKAAINTNKLRKNLAGGSTPRSNKAAINTVQIRGLKKGIGNKTLLLQANLDKKPSSCQQPTIYKKRNTSCLDAESIYNFMPSKAHKQQKKKHKSAQKQVVTQKQMDSSKQDAFAEIVLWSSRREYSKQEIHLKLEKKGYTQHEIDLALKRACTCNLINNQRYAEGRIRYLLRKGRGITAIQKDLKNKGIAIDQVPGWPQDYLSCDIESEISRAYQILCSKPCTSKNKFKSSYSKLLRLGYSTHVAYKAAECYLSSFLEK